MLNQRSDAPAAKAAASGGLSARFACEAVAVSGASRPVGTEARSALVEESRHVDRRRVRVWRQRRDLSNEISRLTAIELLRSVDAPGSQHWRSAGQNRCRGLSRSSAIRRPGVHLLAVCADAGPFGPVRSALKLFRSSGAMK